MEANLLLHKKYTQAKEQVRMGYYYYYYYYYYYHHYHHELPPPRWSH